MAIFESPDGGKTVYKRNIGETERTIIKTPGSVFSFEDYLDILELSKHNESLKKALDHLLVLYYTIKDEP
jgi:hypothetical protein